jgi:Flp pilus assembly protein TadG
MINLLKPDFTSNEKPSLRVRYLRQFGRDEDGGIIVLTLLLLIIMLVLGGMAVDFMRYESRRALLQSVSDRAVLAAAELDQELDSEYVVNQYFDKSGFPDTIVKTEIDDEDGSRSVYVRSQLDLNTFYLRLIGIDQLEAPAVSRAIEGTGNIEISLVLDISGSMNNSVDGGRKIDLLRTAATNFVDELLLPEYANEISISLINYSQHVNIGEGLYEALNTTPDSITDENEIIDSSDPGFDLLDPDEVYTNPARCIDFEPGDYLTTTFDTTRTYEQVETFEHYRSNSTIQYPLCPQETYEGIIPLTQDPVVLKTAISQLEPTTFTSIHLGMKWGVTLLDPSMRDLLATVPSVDPAFAGSRPAEYTASGNAVESIKYVILMTDGVNVAGRRIKDEYYYDEDYAFFWHKTLGEYPYNYWRNNIRDHPLGRDYRPNLGTIADNPGSAALQDSWLQDICDAAKDQEVIVFSIALGAGSTAMQNCASPQRYYNADGREIIEIFAAIARQIKDLRLSL